MRRSTWISVAATVIFMLWTWVMGGLNAEEKTPQKTQESDTARWKPVPGPKELIEGIVGPPAVVKDWERDYLQYQPLGQGDTEQAPDAKPGTPNPPDIHKLGGRTHSSFVFDLSPDEPFEKVRDRERKQRPQITAQQRKLLEQRYDLTPRTASGVMMSRGKPVPMGPTAKLKNRLTFDALGKMSPEEIKAKDLFPYLPPLRTRFIPPEGWSFPRS